MKNSYEQKAKKKQILSGIENTASDKSLSTGERLKKTLAPTLINTGLALGGGFAGAAMGRLSLLTGLIVAGAGEYLGSPATTSFGLGMAVSTVSTIANEINGTEEKSFFEAAKERVKTYGKGLMQKLYLDKIIKKNDSSDSGNTDNPQTKRTKSSGTMGEVKYFTYPLKDKPDPVDMSELERYEKMVESSAENFVKETGVSGTEENKKVQEMSGDQKSDDLNGFYSDDKIL